MENFVLYDEIGKYDNVVIYKGRRKGTVVFLAIYCVDKCKRAEITNQVRLIHEIQHPNIQHFHEWYETSNHLWLVLELCNGGTLEQMIEQDGALPEGCVCQFGRDIAEGLHAIHSLGLVFCDLHPSKLLIDGSGQLKFSDFSVSRVEGENLEELLTLFKDQGNVNDELDQDVENYDYVATYKGTPHYVAPEVIQGGPHTVTSDLWSFGVLLFQLFTGQKPFDDENYTELVNKILNVESPAPFVKGSRISAKPSPDLVDLIKGLLVKDPAHRLHWQQVIEHPLWKGALLHLTGENEDSSLSVSQSLSKATDRRPVTPLQRRPSSALLEHTASAIGYVRDIELRQSLDRPISTLVGDETLQFKDEQFADTLRPKSRQADASETEPVVFRRSNRPPTAQTGLLSSQPEPSRGKTPEDSHIADIIYYISDWKITNISENPKIQKLLALRFDQKSLCVPPYPAFKLVSMPEGDRKKHLHAVIDLLKQSEKGPPTQKRVHLLTYATTLCESFADWFCEANMLGLLVKQMKEASHIDLRTKISRFICNIASQVDNVSDCISLTEPVASLTDMIREHLRNSKLKSIILPALGELLFLIGRMEDRKGEEPSSTVPSLTFTMILKCLKDGEDAVLNHYAAKIIENVVSTNSHLCAKFMNSDVGQALWYLVTHSMNDAPRITALTALVRMTRKDVAIFETLIEKVGLPNLLSIIKSHASNRIHQAYLTMLCEVVLRGQHKLKYIQQKELMHLAVQLLDSTSPVVRGKAFLLIYLTIKDDRERLLSISQTKLFVNMERDKKKQHQLDKPEAQNMAQYLQICLDALINQVTKSLPCILGDLLELLEAIKGRRHLAGLQAKQLRTLSAIIPLYHHLLSSVIFRLYLLDEECLLHLVRLLEYTVIIDQGDIGLTGGSASVQKEEFNHSVLGLFEVLMQQTGIVASYQQIFSSGVSKPLTILSMSEQGETKLMSLKLLCELTRIYSETNSLSDSQRKGMKLHVSNVCNELLPQYELILMDLSPIPVYGMKLLRGIILLDPGLVKEVFSCGLLPVIIQVIEENTSNPLSLVLQNSLAVLDLAICSRDIDLADLFSKGLIETIVDVCQRLTVFLRERGEQTDCHTAHLSLVSSLTSVQHILKHLSEVVRKALQSHRTGGQTSSDAAEQALHSNKPLADLIPFLPGLMTSDDNQVSELSLKCLSLLVQLFGGADCEDALDSNNIKFYRDALVQGDPKRQKFILRILKRLVTTDKQHLNALKSDGAAILATLNKLSKQASANADAGLSAMAQDIQKAVNGV